MDDASLPQAPDPLRRELAELCGALRAHLDLLEGSGAWGLPAAPPRQAPAPAPSPADPRPVRQGQVPDRPAQPTTRAGNAPRAPVEASTAAKPTPQPTSSGPASPPATQSTVRLLQLAEEVKGCTRCALHRERTQTVFARGTGRSGVLFLGEGPGEEEDRKGEPFVGPAGQLLDRMIAAMQLARDDVYVCNVVKCRPPRNRKPEPDEMSQCRPYLEEQISLLQPRVIVALGATAVQGLLGTTGGITRLRGQWKLFRGQTPVMPTFHPAYLLRQPQAKREVWDDLREVLRHLERHRPAEP